MFPLEEEPHRLTLEIDARGTVRILGLTPRDYYLRFYTRAPQPYTTVEGVEYIPDPRFWRTTNKGFSATILPQGDRLWFRYNADRHWEHISSATVRLLKAGGTIEFQARDKTIRLSLLGATAAIEALAPLSAPHQAPSAEEVVAKLASMIRGNRFKITADDLHIKPNPAGSGVFIFVPRTDYDGVDRQFIWFANAGAITKLNGASNVLTPDVPWPQEASLEIWNGSSLSSDTVLDVALSSTFGSGRN